MVIRDDHFDHIFHALKRQFGADALRNLNQPDTNWLARQRQALNTTYRRRTPPAGFGGDWWALWWRRQKRRHRTHVAVAVVVGAVVGRWLR